MRRKKRRKGKTNEKKSCQMPSEARRQVINSGINMMAEAEAEVENFRYDFEGNVL